MPITVFCFCYQVKSFCAETTAHGFGNLVKQNKPLSYKITWGFIVVIVLTGSVLHLTSVITTYLEHGSYESSKVSQETPRFPYVTVCNTQGISRAHFMTHIRTPDSELLQYMNLVQSSADAIAELENNSGIDLESLMRGPISFFGNFNVSTMIDLGHNLQDLILKCRHSNDDCLSQASFEQTVTQSFASCYTYICGTSEDKSTVGPIDGLSFILYLESTASNFRNDRPYSPHSNILNSFGARITIHDHDTFPLVAQNGIDILLGHSTSISIKESRINKLSEPWGKCTKRRKLDDFAKYDYTMDTCIVVCRTKYVINKCGCYITLKPDSFQESSIRHCSFYDNLTVTFDQFLEKSQCVQHAFKSFMIEKGGRKSCECYEKCEYRIFDKVLSQSIWPASPFNLDFFNIYVGGRLDRESLIAYQDLGDQYREALNGTNMDTFTELVYENFARVNIYFESTNVLRRTQVSSMTLTDMFANIGGTIGLWAGLSIVTMVEVMFLFVKICTLGIKICKNIPPKVYPQNSKQ